MKEKLGLTTDTSTNCLALLLAAFEFGKDSVPAEHSEVFTYAIVFAAIFVLWLTRGHEAILDKEKK